MPVEPLLKRSAANASTARHLRRFSTGVSTGGQAIAPAVADVEPRADATIGMIHAVFIAGGKLCYPHGFEVRDDAMFHTAPDVRDEIIAALCRPAATISPKFFYDARGSALFERITRLPEYYPTRTEQTVMSLHGQEIAERVGGGSTIIEPGAGNCEKARALCELVRPSHFVAVDISAGFVLEAAQALQRALPFVDVRAVGADLAADFDLPEDLPKRQRMVFYPGSSIGNFDPEQALALLRRMHRLCADAGSLLIGVDLVKDTAVLEAAYNDAEGVTAAFNLNALDHVNGLTGSDFEPAQWLHRAFFNASASRIEMHLEARGDTTVRWPEQERRFARGERIHTENSYKYTAQAFSALLVEAGFRQIHYWTDPKRWFAVFHGRSD